MQHHPRLVIAGTKSGVGKTTLAVGIMAAMREAGYTVQPFKVGPDYIDPGFHTAATGRRSRNLDSYLQGEEELANSFCRAAEGAQLSLIEGVMGLFDGSKKRKDLGSTAAAARLLRAPVVLVLDASRMGQSVAAMAKGYQVFDPRVQLEGVILNKVSSKSHLQLLRASLEVGTGLKVLGYLFRQQGLELPERHMGLIPAGEQEELPDYLQKLGEAISGGINLEALYRLSQEAAPLRSRVRERKSTYRIKLGVARDRAFNFYYQDNLDLLKDLGAELSYFSPLKSETLPAVDGLYLGGGFPEVFARELANNHSLKQELREVIESGLPTYAECGGLMYLCQSLRDRAGNTHPMVGVLPAEVQMEKRLQRLGYVEAMALEDSPLMKRKERVKGHEFHYSSLKIMDISEFASAYSFSGEDRVEGFVGPSLLASYLHLHFGGQPELATNLLQSCQQWKENN